MRNRKIQRQVKRLQKMGMLAPRKPTTEEEKNPRPQVVEKPWLNPEGYRDDTAYRAIRNVMRGR